MKNKEMFLYFIAKRVLDILLSIFLIVLTSPILFTAICLIKFSSPGGAFYSQERVGLRGRVFKIYKLRTMTLDAEKNGAVWASENDSRVTSVGKFLRKTRIDELPQLLNILKNDMSLIGPRPERPEFVKKFTSQNYLFANRVLVKPGLTGYAQVYGGYNLGPMEKLEYDLEYIRKQSLIFDLFILLKTVKIVITGDGAR